MNTSHVFGAPKNLGFTLIELVLIIIMLGVLAVVVIPRQLTSNGFEEFTYQDELIAKLRAIQLRTMQQTTNNACQTIQLTSSNLGLLATTIPNTNTCDTSFAGETTTVLIDSAHEVVLSNTESLTSFSFSPLGRPQGCASITPCEITLSITGESVLQVKINSEGYIYAP